MPSALTDGASSPGRPSNALPGAANRNGPTSLSNVVNMALSPSAANAKPPRSSSPQARATNSPALPADQSPGGAKAAMSFVRRVGLVRKPPPNNALQQSSADGDGSLSPGSDASGATYQSPQPIVTETEVIEPMVPGSNCGSLVHDDALDALVMPPALGRSTLADYVVTAENWISTDHMLAQHEELVARGLLMIRNMVRCEPRYAAQASGNWLPLVRDSLGSKYGLVRAAAASALAAFAASTPHREVIHKDAQVVPRLVQMLTNGLNAGGDNNDTQYACLALSNMALNSSYRPPLLRYGALPRAADVLRAAIRYIHALNQSISGGATAGSGSGDVSLRSGKSFKGGGGKGSSVGSGSGNGGRPKSSSMLKSAAYVAALFTAWAVEPLGREQLQQYDVPSLASELYESCVTALGDEFPLSRRLALLADTSSAAALLEEIAGVAEEPGVVNWEAESHGEHTGEGGNGSANGPSHPGVHGNPHALRGVSFMEAASRGTGTGMGRTAMAMNSLHRLIDAESPSEPSTGGLGSPRGITSRALTKKQQALSNAHTNNGSVPSSPIMGAPLLATTTTITATTSNTVTTASPMPLSPTLLSPRDSTIGGSGTTPRGSKLFSSKPSQAGFAAFPSAAPLGAQQTSAGQLTSPFAQRQSAFPEAGFHGQTGGVSGLASPVASQHQQLSQQLSPVAARSGSMSGVHFSASVFVDAAAAARGGHGDDDGQRRSGQSLLTQLNSQPSSKALKLPAVASGRVSESTGRSSGPLSARSSEHQSTGARLDLPFHLVRPIPTISASSGKVSRISAAYGQVANPRQPSSSGSAHPLHSYPRGYASEL